MKDYTGERPTNLMGHLKKTAKNGLYAVALTYAVPKIAEIARSVPVSVHPNFDEIAGQAAKDNLAVVVALNHQSHIDGSLMEPLAQRLNQTFPRMNGWYVSVARSLGDERQGAFLKAAFEVLSAEVRKVGVEPLFLTRVSDVKDNQNLPKSSHSEEYQKKVAALAENRTSLRRLLTLPEDSKGLLLFTEGGLDGGRTGPDGKIRGIQPRAVGHLSAMLHSVIRPNRGKEALIIPVGIDGSHKVYSPDKKHPTVAEAIGFMTTLQSARKISITIAEPYRSDEYRKMMSHLPPDELLWQLSNDTLRRVAAVVSPQSRGALRFGPVLHQ